MVNQVKVVSILMIVNGTLWVLFGGLFAAIGPLLMAILMGGGGAKRPGDDVAMMVGAGYNIVTGLLAIAVGILLIVAGLRCMKFRGRVLGIIALFGNVLALPTCSLITCVALIMALATMI